MDIHQVVAAVAYGDAISNEAMVLRDVFRRQGRSEIFAHDRDPQVQDVHTLADYERVVGAARKAVLLVHHSIGVPAVAAFLDARREPMIVRYHNITPPEFVREFDPAMADLLELGRRELERLRERAAGAVADSVFNAAELSELGYPSPAVVPLAVDAGRLERLKAPLVAGLPSRQEGPVIAFVGRLAPNKCQHLLLAAYHILKTYLRPDAHLALVGRATEPHYAAVLERFAAELALPDLVFMGQVSDSELAAVYRRCDVLCCVSAHEGFGVPLVEAMTFGVPIVAWATSAVTETLGGAALMLDEPRPALVAEALNTVLSDAALRRALSARGRKRAADFDPERTATRLLELAKPLA